MVAGTGHQRHLVRHSLLLPPFSLVLGLNLSLCLTTGYVYRTAVNYQQWIDQHWTSTGGGAVTFRWRLWQGQLHPFEPFRIRWDLIVLILVLFHSALEVPYRAG